MAEPAAFFGLRISPGEVYPLETLRDVHITNIAFGEKVEGSARSVVKVHHIKFPNLEEDDDSDYDSDLMGDEDDEDDEDEDEDDVEDDVEIKDAAEEDDEDEDKDDDEDDDDDSDSGGVEEEEFVVCSLYPGKIEQCSVNLYFSNLEDVGFSVTGDNDVELLGNYMSPSHYDEEPSDSELFDSDDDEEIDSDEEAFAMEQSDDESDEEGRLEEIDEDEARAAKKAILTNGNSKKRSSDEVDADESMLSAPATDAEIAAVAAAEGLDLSKLSKNQRKRLNKKLKGDEGTAVAAPAVAKAPEAKAQTSEKAKAKVEVTDARGKKVAEEKETVKKDGKEVSQKTKTASGLIIEDQKQGTGVAAKAGNRVGMRYVGRLQGKGTVFDSNTKGKPFFFKLGKGEVIKGWDEGVKGMKVGGERRLVCPPNLAYGRQGAPPTIPANATLVFDVKLVEIK